MDFIVQANFKKPVFALSCVIYKDSQNYWRTLKQKYMTSKLLLTTRSLW